MLGLNVPHAKISALKRKRNNGFLTDFNADFFEPTQLAHRSIWNPQIELRNFLRRVVANVFDLCCNIEQDVPKVWMTTLGDSDSRRWKGISVAVR